MNRHYLVLWAWRPAYDTWVRQPIAFNGDEHDGLARARMEMQHELPGWVVDGSITSRQHYEKLMELREREEMFLKGNGYVAN